MLLVVAGFLLPDNSVAREIPGAFDATQAQSPVCDVTAPVVTSPLTYCQGSAASALSSSITLTSGAMLQLYTTATGGAPLTSDFRPPTTIISSTTYYAAQVVGNCESSRTPVVVNVVTAPSPPTLVSSLAINTSTIAAWGDSFTDSNFGRYPSILSQLSGRTVTNLGVGGENSGLIANRMLADTQKRTWPTIIWAGRNDPRNQSAQTKANIAAMVAALPHTDYLILSVCNGAGEGKGTYEYQQIIALNNDLARIYGAHYLDVRSYLVSKYIADNAQDAADYAADIPPTSLRRDFLHPNEAGSSLIANYIYGHLNQLLSGSVIARYCQGSQATPLSAAFSAPDANATLRFYADASATTPLSVETTYAASTTAISAATYYVAQGIGNCESRRTPIMIEIVDCNATAARPSTFGNVANTPASSTELVLAVYPNPFELEATVDFSLPTEQSYTLDLYNTTGKLVRHLADGTPAAGKQYSCPISSTALDAGLYMVRLHAGTTHKTLRLNLTR
ncbi:Ig-like domain-containing protein [Hymenobacter cavernae]|uniref:T9SS C-terminal target domain-containing protein n=1 Tax=Hymenobacter cavernae TaxID=2044852 RepID=A0ABQ1UJZ7_9BACT|nr:GDSL-type esterase/lipase family protein [Hymenobacter cavernae]GGF20940.1 hypothetical protein GCM10011383_35780 [Hymenobacter cavernae]